MQKLMNRSTLLSFFLPLFCGILCLALPRQSFAAEEPVQMLQGVTSRVMEALKANHDQLHRNPEKINAVVNRYILPYVDFAEMARWVVGRNAWQKADAATQQAFVEEFKTMLVRTYAQSLLSYSNQTIDFSPLRGTDSGKTRVQVASSIKQPGKKNIRMEYRLLRSGSSWKVYDIIIEGVSLTQGFRSQFSEDVAQGGLQNVVNKLQNHNKGKRK